MYAIIVNYITMY